MKIWLLLFEIEAVQKIYLNGTDKEDKRFWIFDKKGVYTVKTGYWNLYKSNHLKEDLNNPSSSDNISSVWSSIWVLRVPPKVKTFIWKAMHDIIPVEANLFRHHIPINPRCILCGFYWSNTSHVLFFCQGIKKLWNHSEWWHLLKSKKDLTLQQIFEYIKDHTNREGWEKLCMRAWGVWKDRCNIIHKNGKLDIGPCPQDHWSDNIYRAFKAISEADKIKHVDLAIRYSLKNMNNQDKCYSIRTDATFNNDSNRHSYGFVLKDSNL